MFCIKCGSEIPSGAAFCTQCGAPANAGAQVTPAPSSPATPSAKQPAPAVDTPRQVAAKKQPETASQQVAPPKHPAATTSASASASTSGESTAKKPPVIPIAIGVAAAVIVVAVLIALAVTGVFGSSSGSGVAAKGSVNDYTWEELSAISDEIGSAADEAAAIEIAKKYNLCYEDGTLDGSQRKDVTLTNGLQTSVQIVGFAHDDKSDRSGKAGITFMFTDGIAQRAMNSDNSNTGGWLASEMRQWLSSDGMELLPQELKNEIVAVDKSTNALGKATEPSSSIALTSDKLWLFSYVELCGEPTASKGWSAEAQQLYSAIINSEGSQYERFKDGGESQSKTYPALSKTYQGKICNWWERTAQMSGIDSFRAIGANGNTTFALESDQISTVVPGFCI